MNKFWNDPCDDSQFSLMQLSKWSCERIDKLAIHLSEEGAFTTASDVFLSHRGPTQKEQAEKLQDIIENEVKFNNNRPVSVFMDKHSMTLGENNLEQICKGICGAKKVFALLEANYFTSPYCILELFLASVRRPVEGIQDHRLLPVYVQDNLIYRQDVTDGIKIDGLPLPFEKSISYGTDLAGRVLDQLREHFHGLDPPESPV